MLSGLREPRAQPQPIPADWTGSAGIFVGLPSGKREIDHATRVEVRVLEKVRRRPHVRERQPCLLAQILDFRDGALREDLRHQRNQ